MSLRIVTILNWLLLLLLAGSSFARESSITILSLPFDPSPLHSQNLLPYRTVMHPKVGLALSGGGARGFAQIGILKALEEARIPIDMIAGTSIGAVIGGLYAIDYSPAILQQIIEGIEWGRLFSNTPRRRDLFLSQKQENAPHFFQLRFDGIKPYIPPAISAGQQLSAILNDLHLQSRYSYQRNFDDLKFPYRAVATDFISGEQVLLRSGDLSQAMLASMAIPLLFSPMEINGRLLVDGGLVDNFPTDVVREMGADIVIGLNTLSPLRTADLIQLPWEQADQVTSIMQKQYVQKLMQNADILISPDLGNRISTDFSKPAESIEIGYRAAKKSIPEIYTRLKLPVLSNEENFSFIPGRIDLQGLHVVSADSIVKWLTTKTGVTTDASVVQGDLYLLYERGYF
ncbi:MAG: patatin-like phospholipase family protein, partial [Patescibacteria group bacterium]|nr:patatin-like phospholipase family protein [Patescibacteria group bacterium]